YLSICCYDHASPGSVHVLLLPLPFCLFFLIFFFFNDTPTTEIYTLSLHDALPIFRHAPIMPRNAPRGDRISGRWAGSRRGSKGPPWCGSGRRPSRAAGGGSPPGPRWFGSGPSGCSSRRRPRSGTPPLRGALGPGRG